MLLGRRLGDWLGLELLLGVTEPDSVGRWDSVGLLLSVNVGNMLGFEEGLVDGPGLSLGVTDGANVGLCESVGLLLSANVGNSLGLEEGLVDGPGLSLGVTDGTNVGLCESVGLLLSANVGNSLGLEEGLDDGPELSLGVDDGSEDGLALSVGTEDGETLGDSDTSIKNMDSTACPPWAVSLLLPPAEPEVEEPDTLVSRKVAPETISSSYLRMVSTLRAFKKSSCNTAVAP
jgi:hypothetical protein